MVGSVTSQSGPKFAADFDGRQFWGYGKVVFGAVNVQTVVDDLDGARLPVKVGESALPTGAATAANQAAANTSLAAIAASAAAIATSEASISNGANITPADSGSVAAGRLFAINCTAAGDVKVKFAGGYTLTFPVSVGFTLLPWQIIEVFVTGTTATATYANLS